VAQDIQQSEPEVFASLLQVQSSFEPASYTSAEYGYSLAHPPDWRQLADTSVDYLAAYPSNLWATAVRVHPDQGYTSVLDYGAATSFGDSVIHSRGLVYEGRPDQSYRTDYTWVSTDDGTRKRAAVLITLGGGNAIWVYVWGPEDTWGELAPLVDDIFLRVAVSP